MTDVFAIARARKALEAADLDADTHLERASSVTNEVWLGDEYVVRVNRRPNQRLRREAFLGPYLPAEVNYPRIVAYGGELGADWLIVARVPGEVLSRCWPTMTDDERRDAVRQLATILRHLHQVKTPDGLPEIDASPQLLSGHAFRAVDPLLDALDRAATLPHVDRELVGEARAMVLDTSAVIEPFEEQTLVHGDLHFENLLWDGHVVTGLLDFEFARGGPPDLDLDVFLRFCAYPYLHVAADYEDRTKAEDYRKVPYWLAEDYPELFAHPQSFARMRLYALAYDVRDLLLNPPADAPRNLSTHHPHNRLQRTVRGTSHLDLLASNTDFDSPVGGGLPRRRAALLS